MKPRIPRGFFVANRQVSEGEQVNTINLFTYNIVEVNSFSEEPMSRSFSVWLDDETDIVLGKLALIEDRKLYIHSRSL
jgi:hypothetical protein